MNAKQRAAEAALSYVRPGTVIGLGTGSTADLFIRALGEALRTGALRDVRGVPTSVASEALAVSLCIPVVQLKDHPRLDVAIDGADEIDPHLNLIKGLGGALLREKMIAQGAERFIVVADATKLVPALGTKGPLPVEVVPFAHEIHPAHLRALGGTPVLRLRPDGATYVTDNGNYIYDCRFPSIPEPAALVAAIRSRAGVVDTGLFLGIARTAIIGTDDGTRVIERPT